MRSRVFFLAILLASSGCRACCSSVEWSVDASAANALVERGIAVPVRGPVAQLDGTAWDPGGWSLSGSIAAQQGTVTREVLRLGYGLPISDDWEIDVAIAGYDYPVNTTASWRRSELSVAANFRDIASLQVAAQRFAARRSATDFAAAASARWPLTDSLSLVASLGTAVLPSYPWHRYFHGAAGLAWRAGPWRLDVTRTTNHSANETYAGSRTPHWLAVLNREL